MRRAAKTIRPPAASGFETSGDTIKEITSASPRQCFLRFPGGNYVEGNNIESHYDWRKTIGPLVDRPTFAGYTLDGRVVKPGPDLDPYVQEALDEIEYVTGASSAAQPMTITLRGLGTAAHMAHVSTLRASTTWATNTIKDPKRIVPVSSTLNLPGELIPYVVPPYTIQVLEVGRK